MYDLQRLEAYEQRMKRVIDKRYQQLENYLHKASRIVIDQCLENRIGTIVIGYNKKWKQKSKMGERSSRIDCFIPSRR
ncbi:MAG: transposase [Candidatus Heimdallarchaeaceae archaeon]